MRNLAAIAALLMAALLSGCWSAGIDLPNGWSVNVAYRPDGKAVLPPENGPDTLRRGYWDSDGIWRVNFGP